MTARTTICLTHLGNVVQGCLVRDCENMDGGALLPMISEKFRGIAQDLLTCAIFAIKPCDSELREALGGLLV